MTTRSVPSIFQEFETNYGPRVRKLSSEFVRLAGLEANWENHRVFNMRCLKTNLIPKCLTVKPPDSTYTSARIAFNASKAFLKQRIYLVTKRLSEIRIDASRLSLDLQTAITPLDYNRIFNKASDVKLKQGQNAKKRQLRKFERLMSEHPNFIGPTDSSASISTYCNVVNMSDRVLNETECRLLEKGLTFTINKPKIYAEEIIPSIESAVTKLPATKAENIRAQLVNIIKFQQPGEPNLPQTERIALNSLKEDRSIVLTKADKGKTLVVMNKSEYLEKMGQHLETGPYRVVVDKTVASVMNKSKTEVGNYLRTVKDDLGAGKWYSLYPKSTLPPRVYGLPKVHKPEVPVRPIVDGIGSPTHELARYFARLLQPLTGRTSAFVKNSYDFAQKIASLKIESDDLMVSFDVTSLFTNVPKEEALGIARRCLNEDVTLNDRTKLTVNQIIEGMTVCLNMSYFVFQSKLYSQEQGLAMGSPISPVLANLYMEDFENRALT
ncbi:unnamed protein product, partial [Dicrocoelium dendriticum]